MDDEFEDGAKAVPRKFGEFDCPDCSANNPVDEGFKAGDEVRCYYCGEGFRVLVTDDGKCRLKPA